MEKDWLAKWLMLRFMDLIYDRGLFCVQRRLYLSGTSDQVTKMKTYNFFFICISSLIAKTNSIHRSLNKMTAILMTMVSNVFPYRIWLQCMLILFKCHWMTFRYEEFVQVITWWRTGYMPLPEPMVTKFITYSPQFDILVFLFMYSTPNTTSTRMTITRIIHKMSPTPPEMMTSWDGKFTISRPGTFSALLALYASNLLVTGKGMVMQGFYIFIVNRVTYSVSSHYLMQSCIVINCTLRNQFR